MTLKETQKRLSWSDPRRLSARLANSASRAVSRGAIHSIYRLARPALCPLVADHLEATGVAPSLAVTMTAVEAEMERITPLLPDVGGWRNAWYGNLVGSVPVIATYLVLRKPEFGAIEPLAFGNILLGTMERLLADRLVGPGLLYSSWRLFAPGAGAKRQRYAAFCRDVAERYPENWLVRVPLEDPPAGAHQFEIQVTRCALYHYLKILRIPEIAPFFCTIDYLAFARLGLGFQRTTVLCQGGDCCDFRCRPGEAAPALSLPLKELPADCRPAGTVSGR